MPVFLFCSSKCRKLHFYLLLSLCARIQAWLGGLSTSWQCQYFQTIYKGNCSLTYQVKFRLSWFGVHHIKPNPSVPIWATPFQDKRILSQLGLAEAGETWNKQFFLEFSLSFLYLFFASRQSSSTWQGNLEKKTDIAYFLWQNKRLKQNSAGPQRSPFFHFSGTNKNPIGGAVSAFTPPPTPPPPHQIGEIYSVN